MALLHHEASYQPVLAIQVNFEILGEQDVDLNSGALFWEERIDVSSTEQGLFGKKCLRHSPCQLREFRGGLQPFPSSRFNAFCPTTPRSMSHGCYRGPGNGKPSKWKSRLDATATASRSYV